MDQVASTAVVDVVGLRTKPELPSRSAFPYEGTVPEISRFFGIIIAMFYDDHSPPHFHVRYGDQKAIVAIETLGVLRGGGYRRKHWRS